MTGPPGLDPGHELVLLASAGDAPQVVLPRARQALDAGWGVVLALHEETAEEVLGSLGPDREVRVTAAPDPDGRPAHVLDETVEAAQAHRDRGQRLALIHQAPMMAPSMWPEWLRVEACVNLWFPEVRQTCIYPKFGLDPLLEEGLRSTHNYLGDGPGWAANELFGDQQELLHGWAARHASPARQGPPVETLVDPTAHDVRRTISLVASGTQLTAVDVDAMVFAASEVVANALLHGRPPVRVGIWAGSHSVTVLVGDAGPGPSDPFVGLREPDRNAESGRGWWLVHRLVDVQHTHGDDGYVAVLSVGERNG